MEVQERQHPVLESLNNRGQEPVNKLFSVLPFNQTFLRPNTSCILPEKNLEAKSRSYGHQIVASSVIPLLTASPSFIASISLSLTLISLAFTP